MNDLRESAHICWENLYTVRWEKQVSSAKIDGRQIEKQINQKKIKKEIRLVKVYRLECKIFRKEAD